MAEEVGRIEEEVGAEMIAKGNREEEDEGDVNAQEDDEARARPQQQ